MDKKGLSTIVTTLIIILLVLVVIGIIWAVVKNMILEEEMMEKISTNIKISGESFSLGENIETSNQETINKSSQANNFLKYCIGVAILFSAIAFIIREAHKFYLNYQNKE